MQSIRIILFPLCLFVFLLADEPDSSNFSETFWLEIGLRTVYKNPDCLANFYVHRVSPYTWKWNGDYQVTCSLTTQFEDCSLREIPQRSNSPFYIQGWNFVGSKLPETPTEKWNNICYGLWKFEVIKVTETIVPDTIVDFFS